MQHNPKKMFFVIALFMFFSAAMSQNIEYYITKSDDTIYGKITRRANWLQPNQMGFNIKPEHSKKIDIAIEDVKIIRSFKGVDGNCIIITIYDKWYLKQTISGKINVFVLLDGSLVFVSKMDSEPMVTDIGVPFLGEKAKAQIRPLLVDNLGILRDFDEQNASAKNLLTAIKKYNEAAQ